MKKNIIYVLIMIFLGISLLLCGCNDNSNFSDKFNSELIETPSVEKVDISGIVYTAEEINEMLLKSFNSEMYYFGNNSESESIVLNSDILVGIDIEYSIYCEYDVPFDSHIYAYHSIHMIITNFSCPESSLTDENLYYHFEFIVNSKGMHSSAHSGYHISESNLKKYTSTDSDDIIFLGKYRVNIKEIQVPDYGEKDDEWKQNITLALEKYVESEYCSLPSGKYDVYIRNFAPADYSTKIFFVNENGELYEAFYNFVNDVSPNYLANINHLFLVETSPETYGSYQKTKSTLALHINISK